MTKLSRKILVKELQEQMADLGVELSLDKTRKVVLALENTIEEAILAAESSGYDSFGFSFGQFKIQDIPQKSGKSALNGKDWTVGAHKRVSFKVSSVLKQQLKDETIKPIV
ncbi:HU family DNA-binding protein [Staphylococcus agnetis]|uniref:HU family DNA-binding protein n=1 Tax=Staphylococcus agnetis TaxID=985762 RepID=UPI0039EC968E